MNYYPFHIGDYLSATRHLSWDEDAAYRRLLDTYYTTEKPLPVDLRAVCRLVVASSEVQREAVKVVLEEFFVLTPDGWVNSRADEEIQAMREKSEQTGERTEHEKTRKERYRERRAFLFAFLRSKDVVPEYDIAMKQLLELATQQGWDGSFGNGTSVPSVPVPSVDGVPGGVPAERDRNVPVDAHGTAIPTPTPTPTPKRKKGAKAPTSADDLPTWMQALVSLYHEILPELPGVRVMDAERRQALQDFRDWVLHTKRPDGTPRATNEDELQAWVRDYFTRARNNDFIMGRGKRSPEHLNWRCSIEYLLSSRGMKKVIEQTDEVPA